MAGKQGRRRQESWIRVLAESLGMFPAADLIVPCEAGYSRRKAVIGWMLNARRAGM